MLASAVFLIAATIVCIANGREWIEQIGQTTWHVNPLLLLLSAVLLLLSYLPTPLGWSVISRKLGSEVPPRRLVSVWFVSQLGRYIPGKVWLFAGRAGFLRASGMKLGRAAFSTGLELLLTVASVGLMSLVFVWTVDPTGLWAAVRIPIAVSAAAILMLPALGPVQRLLARRGDRMGRCGENPQQSPEGRNDVPVIPSSWAGMIVLLYGVLWTLRGFSLFLWLSAFGLQGIPLQLLMLAVPLAWLAGYVAFIIPGGIGVREGILVSILSSELGTGPLLLLVLGQRALLGALEVVAALVSLPSIRHVMKLGGSDRAGGVPGEGP